MSGIAHGGAPQELARLTARFFYTLVASLQTGDGLAFHDGGQSQSKQFAAINANMGNLQISLALIPDEADFADVRASIQADVDAAKIERKGALSIQTVHWRAQRARAMSRARAPQFRMRRAAVAATCLGRPQRSIWQRAGAAEIKRLEIELFNVDFAAKAATMGGGMSAPSLEVSPGDVSDSDVEASLQTDARSK
ncbi:unnamed protein product, partial [Prorocentrum cordatum]